MIILGIETSCDETAVAVIDGLRTGLIKVLSSQVASSLDLHTQTGGIVPEVAAREQIKSMMPMVKMTLEKADIKLSEVDAVAVTVGPGLVGSLLVGVETAKTLALIINKPLIPINHLMAHFMVNWIGLNNQLKKPPLPALGLLVSGGHTEIIEIGKNFIINWIGGTRDDAAGECLDKCARVLDLPYPGGPAIAKLGSKYKGGGNIQLPKPFFNDGSLEMSFSGLKTAVKRAWDNSNKSEAVKIELAYKLEKMVAMILIDKVKTGLLKNDYRSLIIAGGVAANKCLRKELEFLARQKKMGLWIPKIDWCTDNGVMVAIAGVMMSQRGLKSWKEIGVDPGLKLENS